MTNWTKIILPLVITIYNAFNLLMAQSQPTVSLTFDDGMLAHRPGYTFSVWNQMLLDKLKDANITAALFVAGNRKDSDRGQHLLKTWDDGVHIIANHTWNHPNYNNPDSSIEDFKIEILKTDSLINGYKNYKRLFRFPYLKEGGTPEKVMAIRNFLDSLNYKTGYVTIDASDWYIDSRLVKRFRESDKVNLDAYRDFYLNHIWERAQFYEKLSFKINKRHIKHNLLLHHNLLSALFIDDLLKMFKKKGWTIVSANEAFEDPIYSQRPDYASESLIYAMAKDSGDFEDILRYPAEDSRYEKDKMEKLGL